VSLTNLAARVPVIRARRPRASRGLSAHQRSLLALARLMSEPPADAGVPGEAVEHARTLVDGVQEP